jgi:hypothetical protein
MNELLQVLWSTLHGPEVDSADKGADLTIQGDEDESIEVKIYHSARFYCK